MKEGCADQVDHMMIGVFSVFHSFHTTIESVWARFVMQRSVSKWTVTVLAVEVLEEYCS